MIFLAYFTINKENLSKKVTKIYLLLFFSSPFIFIFIGRFVVPLLGSRYSRYGSIDAINISFSTFPTLPLIILLLFFYKKFKGEEQLYFKLFTVIYALSIVISLFGGMIGLGRLIFYSYTAFILGAAMIIKKDRFKTSKILFSCTIILYGFLYLFYSQFINEMHIPNLFPYENIFFTL